MKTPKELTRLGSLALAVIGALILPGFAAAHDDDVGRIKVMTRNMYIGADISPITEATQEEIPFVAAALYAKVQASNPAERVDAMAAEIARTRPDLVALQEAMLIRVQDPSDIVLGGNEPADTVAYDFLALLEEGLARRGLDYEVAAVLENVDVELPAYAPGDGRLVPFIDVRVTDRIAVLARKNVTTSNVFEKHYDTLLTLPIPGQPVEYLRGFIALQASVRGHEYTLVNTHLELDLPGLGRYYQSAQAYELLLFASTLQTPFVIAADMNSGPQHPLVVEGIPSPYAQFLQAGLVDAWTAQWLPRRRESPGYTCCQDELLRNLPSSLDRRIDFVWLSNGGGRVATLAWRVGAFAIERTSSGLWPSDHAGVVARMYLALDDE